MTMNISANGMKRIGGDYEIGRCPSLYVCPSVCPSVYTNWWRYAL